MEGYVKKKPYLTVIFMWDEMRDYILSSKYEPVWMGQSEVGFLSSDNSLSPSLSTSTNSEVSPKYNMATMVTDVIAAVMGKEDKQEKKKTKSSDSFEELPLKDIMMLMNEHKSYLKFLKDCDMCTCLLYTSPSPRD